MSLNFNPGIPKELIFEHVAEYLQHQQLRVEKQDSTRPWGGFFVIREADTEKFISRYFPQINVETLIKTRKLSPKILIVAPGKRLSWQYHNRRSEIWNLVGGEAGVVVSDTNEEKELRQIETGDTIQIKQGERHRLVGMEIWGIVAEIWQHTEPENPSNEDDIVRLQDDFGR